MWVVMVLEIQMFVSCTNVVLALTSAYIARCLSTMLPM